MDSKKLAAENFDYAVKYRRDFHQDPEPSMQELRTTAKIAGALEAIGIPYKKFEPTGLIGTITGGKPGITVALRADIDALTIQEKTGLPFASKNEGIMHACGHDTHGAMLLAAAKALWENRAELEGTVKVLFQPAEESAQGAKAVIAQGGLEGVDMIFGQHIFSQDTVGKLSIGVGASAAATDEFHIIVKGNATHGAMPQAGADAVVAASAIVMNLQTLVSREISPMEPLVVTVGKFSGGTRWNIVAGEARLEGTVRTFSRELHDKMPAMMERVAQKTAETFRCSAELEYLKMCEVLVNDDTASRYARKAAETVVGGDKSRVSEMPRMMGGEDFAEYTAKIRGGFVALGGGGKFPQHSDYFQIDEEAMKTGIAWYIQVAVDCLLGKGK